MDGSELTRRGLLRHGGAAVVTSMLGGAFVGGGDAVADGSRRAHHGRHRHSHPAPHGDGRFYDGLASGEPSSRGAVLWTRLGELERRAAVELEVALEPTFQRVVARERLVTGPETNGAVKAYVGGLAPHQQYYYRFSTKAVSTPVGRFRTAPPPGSRIPIRFAFFSCQDYTHGWYNALQHMSQQDLDFAVNLGDYIYAETVHTLAEGTAVRDDGIGQVLPADHRPVAVTLDDYRAKYSLYRQDPALRNLHAAVPLVGTWDDHEVQNDYNGGLPDGGLSTGLGYTRARQAAAYRAWFESMPLFPVGRRTGTQIYRRLRFGDIVDLLVLDERQYRDAPPQSDGSDLDQPRAFLGEQQMGWLKHSLSHSRATWKVIGGSLMAMPLSGPGTSMALPYIWQGYLHEREELLHHIDSRDIRDVIFVSGDVHTFFAGDVRRDEGTGKTVALEFVGGSISSIGLRELGYPQWVLDLILQRAPWLVSIDGEYHGYGLVEASRDAFDCRFVRMETIKQLTTATLSDDNFHWPVQRGQTTLHNT